MATSARTKADAAPSTASSRAQRSGLNWPDQVTDNDIARRAYDLYLARNGEPGHEIDDWLQAERELREAANSPPRYD